MPLLIGGLERALQLAEAMVARGFASNDEPRHVAGDQAALVGGLAMLLCGWLLRLVWGVEGGGIALMVLGVGLVVFTVWRAGRRVPRTYYRIHQWRAADTVVVVASAIVVIVMLVPLPWIERSSLFYYPYPKVLLPTFNSLIGIATLGLIAPALLLVRAPASQPDRTTA
jgi:energy-coupling factor transport system permease protein